MSLAILPLLLSNLVFVGLFLLNMASSRKFLRKSHEREAWYRDQLNQSLDREKATADLLKTTQDGWEKTIADLRTANAMLRNDRQLPFQGIHFSSAQGGAKP